MEKTKRMKFDVELWKKMIAKDRSYHSETYVIFGLDRKNKIAQYEVNYHIGTLGYDGLGTISKQELDEFKVPFRVGAHFSLYTFKLGKDSKLEMAELHQEDPFIWDLRGDLLDENARKAYEDDKSFSSNSKITLFSWTDEDRAEVLRIKINHCKRVLEDKNSEIYKVLQKAKEYKKEKEVYQKELKQLLQKKKKKKKKNDKKVTHNLDKSKLRIEISIGNKDYIVIAEKPQEDYLYYARFYRTKDCKVVGMWKGLGWYTTQSHIVRGFKRYMAKKRKKNG